jgi:hypothetical protein
MEASALGHAASYMQIFYGDISMTSANIYTLGGVVHSDHLYIEREADVVLLALCRKGEFVHILTPRQLGKSSLRRRIGIKLDKEGFVSIGIDLNGVGTSKDAGPWYLGVLLVIEEELKKKKIDTQLDVLTYWAQNSHLTPTQRFTRFVQDVLLVEIGTKIVVFVDEIDITLNLPFKNDFFAAIRYLYEARFSNPDLLRISFVLVGTATPTELINDPKRTPFNIGQRVDLLDFTRNEAAPLATGLGLPPQEAAQVLDWIIEWTGGHPYLTQKLCIEFITKEGIASQERVNQIVRDAFFEKGRHSDINLRWVDNFVTSSTYEEAPIEKILKIYRDIYQGNRSIGDDPQSPIITRLKLSGIVRLEDNVLRVRNRIYRETFNSEWIEEYLPAKRSSPIVIVSMLVVLLSIVLWVWSYYYNVIFPPSCDIIGLKGVSILMPADLTIELEENQKYSFMASDAGKEVHITINFSQSPAECETDLSIIWTVLDFENQILPFEDAETITYTIPPAGDEQLFHVIVEDRITDFDISTSFTLGTEIQ